MSPRLLPAGLAALLVAAACAPGPGGDGGLPTIPPATATPTSGPTPTPVEADYRLVAANLAFSPRSLTVKAGVQFTIGVDNRDASVPHDVIVSTPTGGWIVQSDLVPGPAQFVVHVPALQPGIYVFTCSIHPSMSGQISASQ